MNFTKSDILKRGRLLKSETELQYDEQEEKMVEYKKVFNAPPTTSTLTTGCNCVKSNQGQLATNVFLHAACTAAPKCKQLCKFSGFCTGFLLQCTMCAMYILLYDSPVSKIALYMLQGYNRIPLYIRRILAFYAPNLNKMGQNMLNGVTNDKF